ncbi:PqqD family protein [Bdellovibrio sp.]|uniref:PqqD family protein n=1 Tax=Bdellovibrio TaxID=958 RepID=UPI003221826F
MMTRNIDWRVRTVGTGIFLTNSLKVFEVNSTAAKVFLMCDGKNDMDMMVSGIKSSFQTECPDQEIRGDIEEVLATLKEIGAVQE